MERSIICPCGHVALWHGTVQSPENSQQLADWYSLSHIVHGFLFYAGLELLAPRQPRRSRLIAAVALEALWELLENSPVIIDRYRAVTVSWGYSGDSIINSLGDIGFMMLGFYVASRLSWRLGLVCVAALELVALYAIRDNLVLNVIMLVAPVDAIRMWQAG